MIDPADDGVTLPLPVTAECRHSLRYVSESGMFTAHLQQDLFGDWMILQSWGKVSKRVDDLEQGVMLLAKIAKRLEKQGCQPVGFTH